MLLNKLESKKIKKGIILLLVFPFVLLITHYVLLYKTVWYPMWQLNSEWMTPSVRLSATYDLYVKYENINTPEQIAVLISNIDDFEEGSSIWGKGEQLPVAYGVSAILQRVTKNDFGNFSDGEEYWQDISNRWKAWYELEYLNSNSFSP